MSLTVRLLTALIPLIAGVIGPIAAQRHADSTPLPLADGVAVVGQRGMVSSASAPASHVGVQILRQGGNAVDAAIAVGLALAVTYPAAGNLGGGGFMVIRMRDGRTGAVDFRETAPKAAFRGMYLDPRGGLIPNASTVGYRATGVPGTIAGFALARKQFGKLSWETLVWPAEALAKDGFPVSPSLARSLSSDRNLAIFPETSRVFQRSGDHFRAGEALTQQDLGKTLRRLRQYGPREFYEGETARLIAADMKANGGLITLEDLKSYKAVLRKPVVGSYRGHQIITMPPPSSGGIALVQMLNVLEALPRAEPDSVESLHQYLEVMKRAFADRAEFLGDPDFVNIPSQGLTSKAYARALAEWIPRDRATPSEQIRHGKPAVYESPQTTHYSLVDSEGNAVAVTYTLNSGYGSGVTVKGAGFLLNNEMDDFVSKPGVPNQFGLIQGKSNAIAPRKRPLSSMTPTIVVKSGKLVMALGSPGGPTIISTVLRVITGVIDDGLRLEDAVRRPRIHHQWMPDSVQWESGLAESTRRKLQALGHKMTPHSAGLGDVQAIYVDSESMRRGVSDHRSPDGLALAE